MPADIQRSTQRGSVQKSNGSSSSLADVLNIVLDKGIVIDAWARISVIGIEVITIEARVVVASVETYLHYAEAIGLTSLASPPNGHEVGRQLNQGQPDQQEVAGYLQEHGDGVRMGELEAYFDASRDDLGEVLDQLVEDEQVRRDDQRQLYYPVEQSNGGQSQREQPER